MIESLPRGLSGARQLLKRAREIYDAPDGCLAEASTKAWHTGFASGGEWMRLALGQVRQKSGTRSQESGVRNHAAIVVPILTAQSLTWLGIIKYGLACAATFPFIVLAFLFAQPLFLLLCLPAFYAVEAQMVFLFPLALDGSTQPYFQSLCWTRRVGGTLTVMGVVLPIAVTMLFGGFVGRGYVRSWCLGCLAVCVWYEELRRCQDSIPLAA